MTQVNGMTLEQYTRKAILAKRKPPHKGIHTVFSGLNEAIRRHFGVNPVDALGDLVKMGKFVVRPTRGGVLIYIPTDAPANRDSAAELHKLVIGSK